MKVLVVGSGGREHALCWAISRSKKCKELYAAPGNAGIESIATCVEISPDDMGAIVEFAQEKKIDFVVIGPEGPLVVGLADSLTAVGIKSFGPSAAAARIEGSKGFMKDLMSKYGIPTSAYGRFDEPDAAKEYILRTEEKVVVKADGLAAGKGVILCHNKNEAYAAIDHLMTERAFGNAGDEVLVEEFMEGEEVSFFALVDGNNAIAFASAQDHKAAFDGDTGPNTGGMGAYSPAPIVDAAMEAQIMETIINPTVKAMSDEGCPFTGVLFAGLMITEQGPRVLEFNARFGDPECQALMVRMKSDVLDALLACSDGTIDKVKICWSDDTALTVVMAANGYPGHYDKGSEIKNISAADAMDGVNVFHGGTKYDDNRLTAVGGRVLGVTATGKSVLDAQTKAYKAVDVIDWPGGFCRRDIGWRAVKR